MFINDAIAQTTEVVPTNSVWGTLIQLGLIFAIFYLLLIRPQQKKIREHEVMLANIKKGDKIITSGGIYATVIKVEDSALLVEIASGLEIKLERSSVRDVVSQQTANIVEKTANTENKKSKKVSSNKKGK